MRKFCKILSVFILSIISLLLFACKNNKTYFALTNNSCEMVLNESINLNNLKYKTNIEGILDFKFNIEDESILKLEENVLTAICVGNTKIQVNIEYKGKIYKDYILVTVVEAKNINNNLTFTKTTKELEDNVSVSIINIYKDNEPYHYFNFYVDKESEIKILNIKKFNCKLEVKHYNDSDIKITIESKDNINNFIVFNI